MYSCGSVGREDDNRGPWFESRHRQNLKINIVTVNCWKDKNKEKEAKNGSFFKFFNDIKNDIFKSQHSACFISQVKSYPTEGEFFRDKYYFQTWRGKFWSTLMLFIFIFQVWEQDWGSSDIFSSLTLTALASYIRSIFT